MSVPRVLILTGDTAESLEVMHPYQRLTEEGYEEARPARRNCALLCTTSSEGMTPTCSEIMRGTFLSQLQATPSAYRLRFQRRSPSRRSRKYPLNSRIVPTLPQLARVRDSARCRSGY